MINIPPVHISKWLLPFSWLYGLIVFFRNKFFDWGIFKQEEFDIPVICIGNLTVGGTGKTPHTEYLVRLLKEKYRIAVLSRGYKRKTKGFILATPDSTCRDLGDEPFQIKQKFPDILVAVDADRRRGINRLLSLDTPPEVVILDDAFQHRYVKPSFSIVLSDCYRPIYEDSLLPAGRLREAVSGLNRADTIIITKCPHDIQPIDLRIISHNINAFPFQGLYFTSLAYKGLSAVFENENKELPLEYLTGKHILLVTGIASPKMILKELSKYTDNVESVSYPDHYNFKPKDIKLITDKFEAIDADNKLILVTEKDASRLVLFEGQMDENIKDKLYYLPIEITFVDKDKNSFNEKIFKHVRENSGDRSIYKR